MTFRQSTLAGTAALLLVTCTSCRLQDFDLNGDGVIDLRDVNIIMSATGTKSYGANDPRDLDSNGKITTVDARLLAVQCSKPGCAVQ